MASEDDLKMDQIDQMERSHVLEELFLQYLQNSSSNEIRKLEKELQCLNPISLNDYKKCSLNLRDHLISPLTDNNLHRISQLLERKHGHLLFQHSSYFLVSKCVDTIELWLQKNVNITQAQVHMSIRIILQTIQHIWKDANLLNDSEKYTIYNRTRSVLLSIIKDDDCALESVMLAGTCIVRFLCSVHLSNSELIAINLMTLLANPYGTASDESVANGNPVTSSFAQLVLLTGIMNCGCKQFLTQKLNGVPFTLFIFPLISRMCECNSSHHFQAFQLLASWLLIVKKNLSDFYFENETSDEIIRNDLFCNELNLVQSVNSWWTSEAVDNSDYNVTSTQSESARFRFLFQSSSRIFCELFNIISVNWETGIHGIGDVIKECFRLLMELHVKESQLFNLEGDLVEKLVQHHMQLPWTSKGKYAPLAILIPHYGARKLLQKYPDLPKNLKQTLFSNPLATSGTDVYCTLLQTERKGETLDTKHLLTNWQETWLFPLKEILENGDSIAQQNLFRYWLPQTLAVIPEAYTCLVKSFNDCHEVSFQTAILTVMKQARQSKIITLDEMDVTVIEQALFHLDDNVRIQALALLCSNHKTAEPISDTEIRLINNFLPYNLNVDSAPYRQQLVNHMKSLLVRIRDSCISLVSQQEKQLINQDSPQLQKSFEFVDGILHLVVRNLYPGANYQRRQTCLDLLHLILDTLAAPPTPNKRKGAIPEKTVNVVLYAEKRGLWRFKSDDIFQCLLVCLKDFMSDIKLSAMHILRKYFCNHETFQEEWKTKLLTEQAHEWMQSLKPHVCESGALLANFINSNRRSESACQNDSTALSYLEELFDKLQDQFTIAEKNMFLASKEYSMHGVILALRICLSENDWTSTTVNQKSLTKMLDRITVITEKIVQHVLAVLSSNPNSNLQVPSFEEMGNAIADILDASGVTNDYDNPAISLEHQLILSCCWLSLKECSYLISKMVTKFPLIHAPNRNILTIPLLQRSSKILVDILMCCRHKGAIEACSIAFGEFCKALMSEQLPDYRNIPKNILKSVLEVVETAGNASSITRRSAGLPLLVVPVIASEPKTRNRSLLEESIAQLLNIAAAPLDNRPCDTVDRPQTHALHILRALVHDAILSQAMIPYIEPIVKLCIENFSSSSWAVRNASLQLFGSLTPRVLGQKKVRDDNSQHNSVTAEVLFHRFPLLKEYLLQTLRETVTSGNPAYPGLVPILSLLAKLTPVSHGFERREITSNEFPHLLEFFTGSNFFVIRKLAADAFVATTCETHSVLLRSLLKDLDRNECVSLSANQLHGKILIVHRLLRNMECSRGDKLELRNTFQLLLNRSNNLVIRALILRIFLDVEALELEFMKPTLENFLEGQNEIDALLWKPGRSDWVTLMTDMTLKTAKESQLTFSVQRLLSRNNQEEIMSCLTFLKTKVHEELTPDINTFLQEQLISLVRYRPHPFHVECSLEIIVQLVLKNGPAPCLKDKEMVLFLQTVMNGSYGTLAAANSTVVVGLIIVALVENEDFTILSYVDDLIGHWSRQVFCHSDPKKAEDLRMKTGEALQLCGPQLLNRMSRMDCTKVENWIVDLFDAGVLLLTDENWDVRQKAAQFAARLPRSTSFHSFSSISSNYGLHVFVNYFSTNFGKVEHFVNTMWKKLSNHPSTQQVFRQEMTAKSLILFEQDDVNIYVEPCELIKLYTIHLQAILNDNQNATQISSWLHIKCKETLTEATETYACVSQSQSTSDLPSINLTITPKLHLALMKLNSQIKILTDVKIVYETMLKEKLEEMSLKLKSLGIPVWTV